MAESALRMIAQNPQIRRRGIASSDMPFLLDLYASTRAAEMNMVPWSDNEKKEFLTTQFDAQHKFYIENFPQAQFDLLLVEEEKAGRLYLDRRQYEIRIIDIALMPDFRRMGFGKHLINEILSEGQKAGLPVGIHVEKNNPALSLYDRLGFEVQQDQGVYYLMQWSPV